MFFYNNISEQEERKAFPNDELELHFCHSSDIDFDAFSNWIKNRPPDIVRVQQIKEHFLNNNTRLVPGIISIWNNFGDFYIYDGIHRFLAVKEIVNQTPEKELFLLMQFKLTKHEQEIIDDFINLNKSVNLL
jgi:hypothetical protein